MELICGFTTGACATAATKAAAIYMDTGHIPESIDITLPGGDTVVFDVEEGNRVGSKFSASVIKDAGDDPDITNGALITSTVWKTEEEAIVFLAGKGVGTITKAGFQLPVGEAAINPVPRNMMISELSNLNIQAANVQISVAGGEELAKKTFNPRLGVIGGISIIGTTGIVRPYNRESVKKTIDLNINVVEKSGIKDICFVPGNLGSKAALSFGCKTDSIVEVGNEWEHALQNLSGRSFQSVAILGHPGKLAKFIAGEFYTRSGDSGPATNVVREVASKVEIVLPEVETVEGMFAGLSKKNKEVLGNTLADMAIERVVKSFSIEIKTSIYFTSMQGAIIGEATWQF